VSAAMHHALLLLVLSGCAPKAAAPSPAPVVVEGEEGARVDELLERLEIYGMSGSILVAKGDQTVLQKGYGLADRAGNVPIGPDTPFVIGSLSKQFTAAAVVKLASQGKLSLDDRLDRFFPDAPEDKRAITVHQLLSHTSGLPYLDDGDMLADAPRKDVMADMLALKLDFAPGEQFGYSSPGYTLLAGVIEAASGKTFEQYVQAELFDVSGMTATGFMGEARFEGAATHSYSGANDEGAMKEFGRMDRGVGAGTVVSTPGDLWKWVQALRNETVMPADARDRLWTAHIGTGQPNVSHGYGWNLIDTPKGRIIGHGGDLGGYNADCRLYVERDLVIVFLSNVRPSGPGWREAVMNNVSLRLAGEPHAEPPPVGTAQPDAGFAGTWKLPSGGELDVRVDGDRVWMSSDDRDGIALLAGATPEETAAADPIAAAGASVADGMARKDYAALKENLHPSLPFEGNQGAFDEIADGWTTRLGAYQGADALGAAVLSPRVTRTYHRLRFENGEVIGAFGWVGGKIMAIDEELPRAADTLFAPETADTVWAYDAFTGRKLKATLSADSLALGDQMLQRAGSPPPR
jgi:CubicO group peptidase (beta-lactamase class C family)